MRVEPGALALAEAQQEEVGEDLLVGDDAAQDRDQHGECSQAYEQARPHDRHIMKVEMHAIEEETAARIAHAGQGAAGGIERPFLLT